MDATPGVKLSGFSATSVLDYLATDDDCMDRNYEADYEEY